jgi:anti-anti-sigma factor
MAFLSLQGEIVIGQTETLRDAVQSLPRMSSVILDLSRCTLLDAHGLGVLLQLREQSQATGVSFQLVNVSRPLREVLRITRLDTVFQASSTVLAHPIAA